MMAMVQWNVFCLGLLTGIVASALFFAGLAAGMRLALKSKHPATLLLFSAALRIAGLLWLGSSMASLGNEAIFGFAVAFLLMRFIITTGVRPRKPHRAAQWN